MTTYEDFYEAYSCISKQLLNAPEVTVRGLTTRELLGFSFKVKDSTKRTSLEPTRERYLFGELLWYLSGSYDVDEIAPFSKFWLKIAKDGKINSNYGHRIFRAEKTFFRALNQLSKDIYSRQAIVHINLPKDINTDNKDIPCTMFLHFFVRNDHLNLIVYMRSNDIWKGLTYDFYAFSMFHQIMLMKLKNHFPQLQLGWYQHIAGSLHVYDTDYEKLENFRGAHEIEGRLVLKRDPIREDGSPINIVREAFHLAHQEPDRVKDIATSIFEL